MNSESLQQHFPEVYKDFFSRNDLVVSGCFSFPWGHEGLGNSANYIRIKSKVPLKAYVGFKKIKNKEVIFNKVTFYNQIENLFEIDDYKNVNKQYDKIKELLENFITANGLNFGIQIDFLSETPRGHSFGFSGTTAAIISSGIYILLGKIKNDMLCKYDEFTKSLEFREIFYLSGKIDYLSRYGDTIGHNSIFTLNKNSSPAYFYCEKFEKLEENLENIENIYFKFDDFNKKNLKVDLPIDYCIVFSGLPTDTSIVEHYKKIDKNDEVVNYLKNDLLIGTENKDIYYSKFIENKVIDQNFSDIISLHSIKTAKLFNEIYYKGFDESFIENFIDHIDNYRRIISLKESQNSFAEDFIFNFRKNQINYKEKIGIVPAYSGKIGGGYVIITKHGISRNTIRKTLEDLKKSYPNIRVEYSSYLDGIADDGIKIEQYISIDLYSQYVQKDMCIFKNSESQGYIGDYNEILEKEKNGILLDLINNKIYIKGEKLTSKDLPAQNTTIELIVKLIEANGKEISNKELPLSSYTKNKNEMLGKIILPLIKVINERTKMDFQVTCKGSLNDFYITLNTHNFIFGMVKKIS